MRYAQAKAYRQPTNTVPEYNWIYKERMTIIQNVDTPVLFELSEYILRH